MSFFWDRELCLDAVKEVTRQASLGMMNRPFTDVIKDDIFSYVYFLMKSMFRHTDGTSVLYDISWELFTWKLITILDSVCVSGGFPKWDCCSYLTLTEPPAVTVEYLQCTQWWKGVMGETINTNELNMPVWVFFQSFSCSVHRQDPRSKSKYYLHIAILVFCSQWLWEHGAFFQW